jgi:CheY-like chemotaxis protein
VGYCVVQAGDGATALKVLERRNIDVLLLDIRLPHMNGVAVLEALDEAPTVVVLSGFESCEEIEIRRRFGSLLFDCLRKPVLPPDLIAVTAAAAHSAHSGETGDRSRQEGRDR